MFGGPPQSPQERPEGVGLFGHRLVVIPSPRVRLPTTRSVLIQPPPAPPVGDQNSRGQSRWMGYTGVLPFQPRFLNNDLFRNNRRERILREDRPGTTRIQRRDSGVLVEENDGNENFVYQTRGIPFMDREDQEFINLFEEAEFAQAELSQRQRDRDISGLLPDRNFLRYNNLLNRVMETGFVDDRRLYQEVIDFLDTNRRDAAENLDFEDNDIESVVMN
jgi:hypothetical protein